MPSILFKEKHIEFLMEDILNIFLIVKYTSYIFPFLIYKIYKLDEKRYQPLFVFLFASLILSLLERYSAVKIGSAIPIYHISTIIRYLTILFVFYQIVKHKIVFISLSFIALLIFGFESIYLNGWMKNNEILTVFSNLSITTYSGYCLYKTLIEGSIKLEAYSIYLMGLFMVYSGSSTILSFFETEILLKPTFAAFFLIAYYNILEISLNIGFGYSLWKLKEA
jgi:hypothetical protein